jgi:hypothetical protein
MSSSTAIRGSPQRYLRHFTSISPFAIRQLPIAAVFGSAGASPSHFISSRVPRPSPHSVSVPRPTTLVPFKRAKQICRPRRKTNWGEGVHESLCCEAADF